MPARVQYDPAEECYRQGTFLLQQRGGKEEVNELEYKPDFVFVSSALVLSLFSNLSLFLASGSAANCIMLVFVPQSQAT